MDVYPLPEGVELDLHVYIAGMIEGEEVEMVLSVKGLPSFADQVLEKVGLEHLTDSYKLNDMGTGWRVMTRAEIADYKRREREDHD